VILEYSLSPSPPKFTRQLLQPGPFGLTNRWIDVNGSTAFFPAAVWVGLDPALVLAKLHELRFDQNGIVYNFMHMLENSSIVPNTVDEMLLQSHEGVLRLFPVWPAHHDASFQTLRAYGAFLVSAAIKHDRVQDVTIQSEAGQPCSIQNPWPAANVCLVRNGRASERLTGATLTFPTVPHERIELAPSSAVR
jgi:alpha-L-fucosidase 2